MTAAAWRRRFRAPRVDLPAWSRHAAHRAVYATNETGAWQLATWDLHTDVRTIVTDKRTGVRAGGAVPDGSAVAWFDDHDGAEIGQWVLTPFAGGEPRPLLPGADEGWAAGLAMHPTRTVAGITDREAHRAWVQDEHGLRELARFSQPFGVAGLSADGALVAVEHTEHGDALHPSTTVLDASDGSVVGDLPSGDGVTRSPVAWSPVTGDQRLVVSDDSAGWTLPLVWDLATGAKHRVDPELPGEVSVADWWPDGSALLLVIDHEGRSTMHHYECATGATSPYQVGDGTIAAASVRPDGTLWYAFGTAARPTEVRSRDAGGDRVLLRATGADALFDAPFPEGAPYQALRYPNGEGDSVHAFLAVPDGTPPYPLVVEIHGGPTAHVSDTLDPYVQAWVDHGFAVLLPNYRGSTGFGKAWEDALAGDPGRPELVDVRAGRDHLVADGIADPARSVVVGASWGGYLTLQALGTQPEAWAAGVATVPVADYLSAYADEAPDLQAFDRSLFGGDPAELPDLYRERSPLTHVDRVVAPVLVITGANDTRCPKRQVDNYVTALAERGVPHVYDVYDAGHASMATDEQIRQQAVALDFAAAHLGTPPAAP